MHMEYPAVYHLPVHLPGQNTVVFCPEDDIEDVVNNVRIALFLDGLRSMQILNWWQQELITICIKIFQRGLFGIGPEENERSVSTIRPLVECTLFLSLLVNASTCMFC